MPNGFDFYCVYCGKDYGDNLIQLARHLGKKHDGVKRKSTEYKISN